MTRDRLWPTILFGWIVASTVLTIATAQELAHLWFPDPDDALRLVEVRDWIGGQSWWDVGQHRLNGGHFPMHWSRLVDLPLAAVMIVADALFGVATSDRITMTVVPLLTLGVVMALGAKLTALVAGVERAGMAVLLAPLSVPLIYQLRPMRIDHHGWQIALALAAAVAMIAAPTARRGAIAGAALAALVTVSLEGLPIAVAIIGIAALHWTLAPARRGQLLAMVWTLFAGVVALHVATRGPNMFVAACDAIAPGWIAALGVATVGVTIATLAPTRGAVVRLAMLAVAGGAALATLLGIAPDCARGPFATLDPLVYKLWYSCVSEGLPIWDQTLGWALATIGFPIAGLIGAAWAFRTSRDEARTRWATMLALATAAFVLSLLVMRSGATANAFALPGGAVLLHALLVRARMVKSVALRTVATAGALIAATPGLAAISLVGASSSAPPAPTAARGPVRKPCDLGREVGDLRALPAATLFAPIDITPAIIALTPHRAIAGGYHRNADAIHRVFSGFLASPDVARRIVVGSGADYVVACPGVNETDRYKVAAPNGLWARLERGEAIDWLQPVVIPHSPVLVWRVIDRLPPHRSRV